MTCIVAVEKDGVVYMGGDSAGVAGGIAISRSDEKVFLVQNILYGFTSSFRLGQLLRYALVAPQQNGKDDMAYLVTDFMGALRGCLKEHGHNEGGTFLLGYKGHLYAVDSDYQVGRHHYPYAACGSGYEVALGSLYTTRDWPDSEKRVRVALEAAATFCTGVQGPFTILRSPKSE